MRGNAQSNETRNGNRKGRAKAKSCRTCKIRKVKCDEKFPACRRCVSTGRVCDGYGVWGGGGGNGQDRFMSNACRIAPRPPSPIYLFAASAVDKYYFEWFKCRTSKKIPGLFVLPFWNTLLFQASLNEPAVLHAVLTLSCVHRNGNTQGRVHDSPDVEEQLMLSNYSKAISYLKPHFSNKNRSSVRIALITCVVFVCLEIFRGHFKAAQTHLHNGLNVLIEMQDQYRVADDGILLLGAFSESIDDWILEAFSRLQIQVALFNRSCEHPILNLQVTGLGLPNLMFYSFNDAWKPLEQILYQVFHLTKQIRGQRRPETTGLVASTALIKYQQRSKAELGEWSDIYEASRKEIRGRLDPEYKEYEEFAFRLLSSYNTMASIMADTCLYPDDESVFDAFTEQFVSMMDNLVYNWTIRSMDADFPAEAGPIVDLSRSVVDIGWIPPLYYTATKCRVHRLRLHAIRLLEASTHREGIWDSKIAACVARKVMKIEEKNFYRDLGTVDDFPISSSPTLSDLSAPLLPLSYRIHDVKVDLPDGPMDSIFLSYKQKETGGECRVYSKEFDVVRKCWIDA